MMSNVFKISDYDVVFLSYDEPNADENYEHLLTIVPWAKRVHGVKGSDAAHKACANESSTDRLVIIDADNFLTRDDFLYQTIEIDSSVDPNNAVLSWPSVNTINGLVYGNGGIKCWSKDTILKMKTHENADSLNLKSQVDFCWELNYIPLDIPFSEIRNNASPLQAWRAGFREGVKMSLHEGLKVKDLSSLWIGNLRRLIIWCTVGADVENGMWSILGARQGAHMTNCTDWDYTNVRDFDWLNSFWEETNKNLTNDEVINLISNLKINPLIPETFSKSQSLFFKSFNFNPSRQAITTKIEI